MARAEKQRECCDCGKMETVPARYRAKRCVDCGHKSERRPDRACAGCGIAIHKPSRVRFCSRKCAANNIARNHATPANAFKPGHKSWNTGIPISGMSGRTHTQDAKDKIRRANTGENAPNWKGGISTEDEKFRRTAAYAAWREAVFQRDGYCCQLCQARSASGARVVLHADHIQPFALFPDLRLDIDNGRTLCEPCHRQTETWGNGSRRKAA